MMDSQMRFHWNGAARLTIAMFALLAGISDVGYGQTYIGTPAALQDIDLDLDGEYKLTANIDLSGVAFTPLGTDSAPFTGKLDGDGFSIVNLKLGVTDDIDDTDKTEVALFGAVSGTGTLIENLTLTNVEIIGHKNVAGLAGKLKPDAKISACKVTGKVEANTNVGGLVGHCEGTVEDCSAVVNVTGTDYDRGAPSLVPALWAGGLIGHIHIGSTVKNSSAHGTVTGNEQVGGLAGNHHASSMEGCFATGAVTGRLWVGGLLGHMQQETSKSTTVTTSFATGVVTATVQDDEDLTPPGTGGLVGKMDGTAQPFNPNSVKKSFATGTVLTQDDSSAQNLATGGLVGLMENNAVISDSYALGDVIPDSVTPAPEPLAVGGLVGWADGDITRCFARGDVVAHSFCGALVGQMGADAPITIRDCYSTGDLTATVTSGNAAAGGIAGYTFPRVDTVKSKLLRCFATGDVASTGGGSNTGGLVGFLWDTDIDECFAHGNVTSKGARTGGLVGATINALGSGESTIKNSFATGAVDYTGSGAPEIGGLIGTLGASSTDPCGSCVDTLTNCYSAGLVDNGDTSSTTGGLVGKDEGPATINNCYWDKDESQQTAGVGTYLVTCAMTLEVSFMNWNFSTIWDIDEDDSYPYLEWHGVAVLNPNSCP